METFISNEPMIQATGANQFPLAKEKKDTSIPSSKSGQKKGRLTYIDQREYDQMEETIMVAEQELEEVQAKMEAPDTIANPDLLHETWLKAQVVQERVEKLYARWDELEAKKEQGA